MGSIFVAVTTGQNVANLPPILQYAEAGDRVIWLESRQARQGKWSEGAIKILHDRRIVSYQAPVEDLNSPPDVSQAARAAIEELSSRPEDLYFILNGGLKITPIGLALAGQWFWNKGRKVFFLYGDYAPCRLRCYRRLNELSHPRTVLYDPPRMLSIEEIVRSKGLAIRETIKRWYPGTPPPSTRWGTDRKYTAMATHLIHVAGRDTQNNNLPAREGLTAFIKSWLSYQASKKGGVILDRDSLARIAREVAKLGMTYRGQFKPVSGEDKPRKGTVFDSLFVHWKAASREAFKEAIGEIIRQELGDMFYSPEGMALQDTLLEGLREAAALLKGIRYEEAVFARVAQYIAGHAALQKIVKEVTQGVTMGPAEDPTVYAELDVSVALTNGLIVNFECKSGHSDKKDLESKAYRLEKAVSSIARFYVVVPYFEELLKEPWFSDHQKYWERVKTQRLSNVIAFTSLNPPAGSPRFEASLEKIFAPYLVPINQVEK